MELPNPENSAPQLNQELNPEPENRIPQSQKSKLLPILLFIIILLLVLIIISLYGIGRFGRMITLLQPTPTPNKPTAFELYTSNKCPNSGVFTSGSYLKKYNVKSGDTLLTISTKQLENPSRVNEIIALNEDRYPSLSMDNPFLEVGWELFLPPDYIKESQGKIYRNDGELIEISDSILKINSSNQQNNFFPNESTVYTDKEKLLKGSCVTVIFDANHHYLYAVSPQQP